MCGPLVPLLCAGGDWGYQQRRLQPSVAVSPESIGTGEPPVKVRGNSGAATSGQSPAKKRVALTLFADGGGRSVSPAAPASSGSAATASGDSPAGAGSAPGRSVRPMLRGTARRRSDDAGLAAIKTYPRPACARRCPAPARWWSPARGRAGFEESVGPRSGNVPAERPRHVRLRVDRASPRPPGCTGCERRGTVVADWERRRCGRHHIGEPGS